MKRTVQQKPGLEAAMKRLFLFTLSGLAMIAAPAYAAPTTLVCDNGLRPDQVPHITVDLNAAERTVTVNYPATSIYYGSLPTETPAHSVGPINAVFDAKTIVFDLRDQEPGFFKHFTLDRMTGVLLDYNSVGAPFDNASPNDRAVWSYNCQVGTPKF
jgi:hypothetical protein